MNYSNPLNGRGRKDIFHPDNRAYIRQHRAAGRGWQTIANMMGITQEEAKRIGACS